jgi:hypothetical protein
VRLPVQLTLLLSGCLGLCWAMSLVGLRSPGVISGQVIDWSTKRPVAGIDVFRRELRGRYVVARTDAGGNLRYQPLDAPSIYSLYAASSKYGPLLQERFEALVSKYRVSQSIRGLVLPVIPAASIRGRVTGDDDRPVAGCEVSVLTLRNPFERTAGLAKFKEVGWVKTDQDGSYLFPSLGADHYVLRARCDQSQTARRFLSGQRRAALNANAGVGFESQQITVIPGERRTGIDFHLRPVASAAVPFAAVPQAQSSQPAQEPDSTVLATQPQQQPRMAMGKLSLENICASATEGIPPIFVFIQGPRRTQRGCYHLPFFENRDVDLPPGSYRVTAIEAAYSIVGRVHLHGYGKIDQLAMRHGTRVDIAPGRTVTPSISFLTTAELIDLAWRSLRDRP